MNFIQALVNGLNQSSMDERSKSQLTLGGLIDTLSSLSPEKLIQRIEAPHSYRGYYSDLAFERGEGQMPASEALQLCREAMGEVFQGYKGGDYQMGRNTPLWIANYGECGERLIAIKDDGTLDLSADE